MNNQLAGKITPWSLMRFTFPTIVMMVFMSLYTMVDGVFVSNLIGENALSAINIVYPVSSIIIAISIMLATGGGAIIARNMGEGKAQLAKENFSMITAVGIGIGIFIMLAGLLFIRPIIIAMRATPALYDYCYDYIRILIIFSPFAVLQMLFQFFFVTAGKPKLGLGAIVAGGIVNIVLDYVLITYTDMGIAGAAVATGLGYATPGIFGLIYFTVKRDGTLYFIKPKWRKEVFWQSCFNGSSEMVTNLATAITTFLFNVVMLRYMGENGVAAITVVLYAQFLLTSVYLGYSSGTAPLFSYHYGMKKDEELHKLYKISLLFILISSIVIFAASILLSSGIVGIFVKAESEVFAIARHGFLLFSVSYLFTGINIFASSMFTAFSNGKISALISFLRTFVLIVAAVLLLPIVMGADGVWLAIPAAEFLTVMVSIFYLIRYRKIYHY